MISPQERQRGPCFACCAPRRYFREGLRVAPHVPTVWGQNWEAITTHKSSCFLRLTHNLTTCGAKRALQSPCSTSCLETPKRTLPLLLWAWYRATFSGKEGTFGSQPWVQLMHNPISTCRADTAKGRLGGFNNGDSCRRSSEGKKPGSRSLGVSADRPPPEAPLLVHT